MRIVTSLATVAVISVAMCFPAGTAVAQVPQNHVSLNGSHEVPGPGDSDGKGQFSWSLDNQRLCYLLTVKKIITPIAAHIHKGGTSKAGPVKVSLRVPDPKSSAACVNLTSDLANNLSEHPGKYYVNVHNADFPNGAIRAQLNS